MAKCIAALVCLLALISMGLPALSQGPKQNDAYPEFYFTRLMYTDTRGRGPAPGQTIPTDFDHGHGLGDRLARIYGAWLTDTWDADYQYMGGIQRLTNTKVYLRPHPLPIMSPELFSFPYAYTVEVGQMELTQQQADRMREYLMRGGFWHVDDFWGLRQWAQFERQIRKIFPDCEIVDLPLTHPIFHTFFNIDEILQPPNDGLGEQYTRSGGRTRTWEQADDKEPHVRGISDDHGRLMVLITYNSDFGDAWEWMDDPEYPTKFTGYAYKLGMNSIIYTMTH
jgi:hypothetical protein